MNIYKKQETYVNKQISRMKFYILIILIFCSDTYFPWPIEPVPLRKLVMNSEFIIIGYVRTFSDHEQHNYFHNKAAIEIIEVLQGTLNSKEIILKLDPDFICPATATYYDSSYTLAFLNTDKSGEFYTNSLSYGSKTLSLAEIEIYKSRIIELQNILTIQDSVKQEEQIIKWLIKCAENPVTRWEGTYELAPQYAPLQTYLDKYIVVPPTFQLSDIQKSQIKHILYSIDTVMYHDLGLVDIFLLSDSVEIKKWLVDKIKNKKYNREFTATQLKDRIYFISNKKKKEIIRTKN